VSGLADSALLRRDRLWPALVVSVAVHLVLGGLALVKRSGYQYDPSQQPIVARLVRLGEVRPKEYLPRKEPEAPAAPAASSPAPAVAEPAPTRPAAPSGKAVPAPRPAPKAPASPGGGKAGNRLAGVLSGMQQELAAGSPEGDPLGDSSEAIGDQYLAQVVRTLRRSYRVPATISERERLYLAGTLVLFIEPDGRILRYEFVKRSGNPVFDEALERAVRDARLPPPPAEGRDDYRRRGLQVDFKI
jgi:colicin import membrane protein